MKTPHFPKQKTDMRTPRVQQLYRNSTELKINKKIMVRRGCVLYVYQYPRSTRYGYVLQLGVPVL